MLETNLKTDNCFVTLTYDEENVPVKDGKQTLKPKDVQDFMKRLRKTIDFKVRYFIVGEYGDNTQRPHYHMALFGYPNCERINTDLRRKRCCIWCDNIKTAWGKGGVYLGELNITSAQYIAGYVVKKMTAKDDKRLQGRHPEFARMSLKPGIGADFMHEVASAFLQFDLETAQGDVPSTLRHGEKEYPLGRYLQAKLRSMTGYEEGAPKEVLAAIEEELLPMWQEAVEAAKESVLGTREIFKQKLLEQNKQTRLALKTREKIFNRRKETL